MPSVPPAASDPVASDPEKPVATQFRQCDLTHGSGGRQRRAADRTETGAGADGRHRDTALAVAEPGFGGIEQCGGHAAQLGELPHQQKQGHDGQRVA